MKGMLTKWIVFWIGIFTWSLVSCYGGKPTLPEMSRTDESSPSDTLPYDFDLSNIQAKVSGDTVTITWNSAIAADSRVSYGHVSTDDGGVYLPEKTTSHTVVIAGLEEGRYRYQVESRADNLISAVDDSLEFEIRIYPQISSQWVSVNSAGNIATFTFNTDIPVVKAEVRVLDSTVNPVDFYSSSALVVEKTYDIVSNPTTAHTLQMSIPIAGLYRYIITVVDDEGDTTIADNNGIGYPLTVSNTLPEGGIYRPILIDTSSLASGSSVNYSDSRDTSTSSSSDIDFYDPASQNESGPEFIYKFTIDSEVTVTTLSITGDAYPPDNDIHLLSSLTIDSNKHVTLYNNSSAFRADSAISTPFNLPAGTYYVVVDAFTSASNAGAYTLNLNMQPANSGTTSNPIVINVPNPLSSEPAGFYSYTDSRNTNYSSFAPNGEIDSYNGYSQDESGPEYIYQFTLNEEAVVTATLSNMPSGTDIDIHLLSDLTISSKVAQNVIGRNDKSISFTLSAGTYYLVADSYVTSGGTKKPGPYQLDVTFQSTSYTPPPASHVVQGYYTFFNGYRGDTYIQWDKLTHFIYFCMEFNSDGSVDTTHGWRTDTAVDDALANGKIVLLDACVFGGSKIATLLGSASNRQRFIDNLTSEMQARGAHGVDIDFEIPKASSKSDFVALFQELRAKLNSLGNAPDGKPYRIHMALVPIDWSGAFDMAQITPYIDYAMIMSYGIHGKNSSRAGPGNQLYSPKPPWYYPYSWEYFINHWLNKMGNQNVGKLLAGVGYYSYEFYVNSWSVPATTTASGITRTFKYTLPLVDAVTTNIGSVDASDTTNYPQPYCSGYSECIGYETTSKNPFYFRTLNGQKTQLWYDTQSSLEEKYSYIKGRNLGGIGIWALNYDKGRQETWLAIASQFFP
ncbi:MAG: glycoside hydrolase family 18 protein [Candidatus Hydrogenedentota bacterium]|nr:MAG: glycoside hydrolase family 18 protein [Candidatus Hydrogenedentota bacterium]